MCWLLVIHSSLPLSLWALPCVWWLAVVVGVSFTSFVAPVVMGGLLVARGSPSPAAHSSLLFVAPLSSVAHPRYPQPPCRFVAPVPSMASPLCAAPSRHSWSPLVVPWARGRPIVVKNNLEKEYLPLAREALPPEFSRAHLGVMAGGPVKSL